jgi:parallel beta-helix repeat protein
VVAPGDDLRGLVAAASAGSVFVLDAGTHRMQSAEPKDGMVFLGVEDTVMSGARLLGEFVVDGRLWRFDDVAMTGGQHGLCVEGYDGCVFDQDLFLDDVMLWQVTDLADLAPGRWYWDGDSIYMADDPTERLVELSVAPYAFISSADDVTIKDLEIEKYATPAQDGAVSAQEPRDGPFGERWLIEDVEVSGVHGAGVRTGHSTVVRNSFLHSNGQLGLTAAGGSNVLIEGNEISNNNLAGFRWGWEAGGAKFTETVGLIVRSNSAHDNDGPGLWTDIDAVDTLFEGNTVTANSGPGIFHEISYAAVIRANTVVGNGFGKPEWLWGAGILIAASRDVEVSGNVVADNADGIAGIQQERGSGLDGPYLLQNVTVTGNDISMADGQTGVVADVADAGVFVDRNIVFAENTYRSVSGIRYAWGGDLLERGDWLVTGQGVGSVWL